MLFFPREVGAARWPVLSSVSQSQHPLNPQKITWNSAGFVNSAARSGQSEPELFESFDLDMDRAPSGVLEFSELSGQISQELDFWGVPGQGAGGAGTQASAGSK
eukprot:gene14944-biopygen607